MFLCPRLSLGKVVNLNSQFPHHPLAFYCLPVYHCDAINTATRKLILPNKESLSKCVLGEFSKSQFCDFVKFPGLNPGPRFDRFDWPARFRKRRPENFRWSGRVFVGGSERLRFFGCCKNAEENVDKCQVLCRNNAAANEKPAKPTYRDVTYANLNYYPARDAW